MHDSDAIMILTEWNQYRGLDLEMARKLMKGKIILDTRCLYSAANNTRNVLEPEKAKALGFIIEGVGRTCPRCGRFNSI